MMMYSLIFNDTFVKLWSESFCHHLSSFLKKTLNFIIMMTIEKNMLFLCPRYIFIIIPTEKKNVFLGLFFVNIS